MQSLTSLAVWISLPMLPSSSSNGDEDGHQLYRDPWAAWTMLRALCEHHTQLGIMLTVPDSLSEAEVTIRRSWTRSQCRDVCTAASAWPALHRPVYALAVLPLSSEATYLHAARCPSSSVGLHHSRSCGVAQAAQAWAGEPVKAVMVSTSLFLTNKRGFPTLSRAHQALLASFFRLGVQVGRNSVGHSNWHQYGLLAPGSARM